MSKKRRGMGTWYLRGNVWWIKYHKAGKPFCESSGSQRETDARNLLKKRVGEIEQGTFFGSDYRKLTFENLSQDFIDDYKVNQKRSLWRAKLSVDHLEVSFGGMKVAAIDTPLIRTYIMRRQSEGAKNATINRELSALRRMFRLAVQADKIQRIPHVPMLEENNVRSGFLEHSQYEMLLEALPDYLKPVLIMAYWTGCRKSEILSLRWLNVGFLKRKITLLPKNTKNKRSRIIPLPEELCQTLLALRQALGTDCKPSDLVFTNKGRPIRYIYDAWRTATKKVGLEGLYLHDCRRTAVRNLVRSGVPEKVARTISGHKTRSVFDRYNIVDERDLDDAATMLDRYLGSAIATKPLQFAPKTGVSDPISPIDSVDDLGAKTGVTH